MRNFALIIGVVFTALFLVSCTSNKGSFSLVNKTTETITRASVIICNQKIEFQNIKPSTKVFGSYEVRFDSHYLIEIKFQSGKELRKEIGYITNGMDFQHEITVIDSNIEITDRIKVAK